MGSSNRLEHLTAMTLDQGVLDRMQDACTFGLVLVADVETPAGFLRISDRHGYVGSTFYKAVTNFPVIRRTLGEWLNPSLELSEISLDISNVDGWLNHLLPGGEDFEGWVNKSITVRLGLRDVAATFFTIFYGFVTDDGGVSRDRIKLTLTARDQFDRLKKKYPSTSLTKTTYPDLEDDLQGVIIPVIYGDYTVEINEAGASVPAFVLNGADVDVLAGTEDVQLIISENDNLLFDTAFVYVQRSDVFWLFDSAEITAGAGNRFFTIAQGGNISATVIDPDTGTPTPETQTYQYQTGDKFWCRVKGKDLGAYSDNMIWIVRDILINHGGVDAGDLAANWTTLRDKASPPESALANIKGRQLRQEPEAVITEALQLLEQVRVEMHIDNDLKWRLRTLHFEDFPDPDTITHVIRNWDIKEGSFKPIMGDEAKTFWNRAKADYNFDPVLNANSRQTPTFRNQNAIDQQGKEISEKPVFPNLYIETDVINQLKEMLKLASAQTEHIDVVLTPRSVKKDLGDFVLVNVQLGATVIENRPAMIRTLGYDGIELPCRLWDFTLLNYPGYTGPAGTVGGYNADIEQE